MSFAQKLQDVIRNRENLIEGANRCDAAYAGGKYHKPFGEDNYSMVGQNYAGIAAVVAGVGLLASSSVRNQDLDSTGMDILKEIAAGTLPKYEQGILDRIANATWAATQPMRADKGPLGCANRVNVFDLLDQKAVELDREQIQAAAKFLVEKMSVA